MSKSFKLVALDLDGTTLNNEHKLATRTVEILRKLSGNGVVICIATGRGLDESFYGYLKELNLPQDEVPVVTYNGGIAALIKKTEDGFKKTIIYKNPVSTEKTRQLIDFSAKLGLVLQFYNSEAGEVCIVPTTDNHRSLCAKYAKLVGKKQIELSSYDEIMHITESSKHLIMTDNADGLIAEANKEFPGQFNIVRGSPDPFFVEFLNPTVSKGDTLIHMCRHLNIDPSEVAGFGDGDNDKEMIAICGMGIAMKNAKDAAKDVADVVLEWTNEEDGVAKMLEKMDSEELFAR
jgi:Cof subfamily protein (haloacid dehalogenase superfamily)